MRPLKIGRQILRTGLRDFVVMMVVIQGVFGLVVSGFAFWMNKDVSLWNGILAAVVAQLLVGGVSFGVSLWFALISSAQQVLRELGFGEMVFDHLVGKQEEWGGQDLVSVEKLKKSLNKGMKNWFSFCDESGDLSGIMWWVSLQIQRVILMGTFRVIMKRCSEDGVHVSFELMRSKLGGAFNNLLVNYLNSMKWSALWWSLLVVVILSMVVPYLISHLMLDIGMKFTGRVLALS